MEVIFKVIAFGWSMVVLLIVAQCLIWFGDWLHKKWTANDEPEVWKWRRK